MRDGWLPENALEPLESIDELDVFIGDVFDTLVEDRIGYFIRGSKHIVVSERYQTSDARDLRVMLQKVTKHEMKHYLWSFDERWMDEALTEHVRLMLEYGDPDTVNPVDRMDPGEDGLTYYCERSLLHELATLGGFKVPTQYLLHAYVAPIPTVSRLVTHREMNDAFDEAWKTSDVLAKVSSFILRAEYKELQIGTRLNRARIKAVEAARTLILEDKEKYVFMSEIPALD